MGVASPEISELTFFDGAALLDVRMEAEGGRRIAFDFLGFFGYECLEICRPGIAFSAERRKIGQVAHFLESEEKHIVFSMERARIENALTVVKE